MGNGQHRNRRGSRPRPAPHKHGGASSAGRATTQLIPPTASLTPPMAIPVSNQPELDALAEQDGPAPLTVTSDSADNSPAAGAAGWPAPAEPGASIAPDGAATEPTSAASDIGPPARDTALARKRFYAPGQGGRPEAPDRAAPPERPIAPERAAQSLAPFAANPAPRRADRPERAARVERVERPHIGREPADSDDEQEYTGPRGDVRGSVGDLIDALHEVFVRDRAMASQGGVTRCGVCYLHFPASELIYREPDGFYVCESCAHALGSVRVPMVRRQQRQ